MKLLVVNPNTSDAMTEGIRETIDLVRMPGVEVEIAGVDFGPEALESFYDYTLAGFALCRYLENAKEKYDGVMIACFGDPGLYAVKEICQCPVLGIAETSMASWKQVCYFSSIRKGRIHDGQYGRPVRNGIPVRGSIPAQHECYGRRREF